MAYTDDITITSTHTSTSAAKKYIQPYLHKVFCLDKPEQSHTKSRQNNLHSGHTRPCRIFEQSRPIIHNNALPMATHPKVQGFTLDPNLTYSTHIHTISVHAHKPLQIISIDNCHMMYTNLQHLHNETLTLPIHVHIPVNVSQYKHKTQHPSLRHTNTQHTSTLQG